MNRFAIGIIVVVLTFVPAASFAMQASGEAESETTIYDFPLDDIVTTPVGPGGEGIVVTDPDWGESLVKVRSDFMPELLESVDEL